MSPTLPPKKEVALALIERSDLFVHLDPRIDGVVVPTWFRKQPELVLRVGLNMAVPIPDLRFDDDGVTCTLSFNRQPFYCVMPWFCIFGLRGEDGMGLIWPEDVPREVREGAQAKPKVAKLSVVKDLITKDTEQMDSKDASGEKGEKRDKGESSKGDSSKGDSSKSRSTRSENLLSAVKMPPVSESRLDAKSEAKLEKAARAEKSDKNEKSEKTSEAKLGAKSEQKLEKAQKSEPKSDKQDPKVDPKPERRSTGNAAAARNRVEDDEPPPDSPPPVAKGKGKPKRELPPYLRIIK